MLLTGTSLIFLVLALIVTLDVGAYLLAARRAQAAADAAALAAASYANPRGWRSGDPILVARDVAARAGGRLVRCQCIVGDDGPVRVEVKFPVPAILLTRYAARSVQATSHATLVPP